jgi:hypothetical protein
LSLEKNQEVASRREENLIKMDSLERKRWVREIVPIIP